MSVIYELSNLASYLGIGGEIKWLLSKQNHVYFKVFFPPFLLVHKKKMKVIFFMGCKNVCTLLAFLLGINT